MTKVLFSQLELSPEIQRAIDEMGFDSATPVQSEAIPLIRTGVDVIARSQTGTGKTVAYSIPAIERVDTMQDKVTIQALILCPTRELAQQACEEMEKLARFKSGIHPVAIYGGAPIDKQCIRLRKANIVIGTPGRVMDHMRRKTIKLNDLKMIILDEADEMLNMGFKEDIETILTDTPEERQMVLFSATMPPQIMALAQQFQKNPKLVEIDKGMVTIENIEQSYVEVPHAGKMQALYMLLQFEQPQRAIIFCNTKRMADEIKEFLNARNLNADSIHSDIKQSQRTDTMHAFKTGKVSVLIATDIAARGIDVSDVECVINYDVPQNTEYYIHRIGRTGRAGKSGKSITMCTGRREVAVMHNIAFAVKSEIGKMKLPSPADMREINTNRAIDTMEKTMQGEQKPVFTEMVDALEAKGHSMRDIAIAAVRLQFAELDAPIVKVEPARDAFGSDTKRKSTKEKSFGKFEAILLNIGTKDRVTPNHIVGAITEKTTLSGRDIGKIDISATETLVEVPAGTSDDVVRAMICCKICGKTTNATPLADQPRKKKTAYRPKGAYPRNTTFAPKRTARSK